MKSAYKKAVVGVGVVALAAAIGGLFYASRLAAIGTAYAAKILCSGIFVSQRDTQSLLETDVAADELSFLRHMNVRVDYPCVWDQQSFVHLVLAALANGKNVRSRAERQAKSRSVE